MLTIECKHGVVRKIDNPPVSGALLRLVSRDLLLACPKCRRESEGFLREPGE